MKYFLIILGLLFFIVCCKKEQTYETRIGITNATDSTFQVTVFPKLQFLKGNLYQAYSNSPGYTDVKFSINNNESARIYTTTLTGIKPQNLLASIFDSLIIQLNKDSTIIVRFTPVNATRYRINMYSDSSNWLYNSFETSYPTMVKGNPVAVDNYLFEINENGIIY
jgi:hypothetical protein